MTSFISRALHVQRPNQPLIVLVALTVLLAAAGTVLSALVLAQGVDESTLRATATPIGQSIDTSFGSLRLQYVEHVNGLSEEDMGGAMPGMTGMVHQDSEQVIAYVSLTNRGRKAVEIVPEQFRVVTDSGAEPASGAGTPGGIGLLQPGSTLDTTFRFVVPRDEAHLWMEYRDSRNATPSRFAIGTAQLAPADTSQGDHQHP